MTGNARIQVDRLRLRLPASAGADARRIAAQAAETLGAGASGLDRAASISHLRLKIGPAGATVEPALGRRIGTAVLRTLGDRGG